MAVDNYTLSRIIARRKAIEKAKNNESSSYNKDLNFFKRLFKHRKVIPKKVITEEYTHGSFWDKKYDASIYVRKDSTFTPLAYVKREFKVGNKKIKLSFRDYLRMDYDEREKFIENVLREKYGFDYIDYSQKKQVDEKLENASLEEHLRYIAALVALAKSESIDTQYESDPKLHKAYYAISRLIPPEENEK